MTRDAVADRTLAPDLTDGGTLTSGSGDIPFVDGSDTWLWHALTVVEGEQLWLVTTFETIPPATFLYQGALLTVDDSDTILADLGEFHIAVWDARKYVIWSTDRPASPITIPAGVTRALIWHVPQAGDVPGWSGGRVYWSSTGPIPEGAYLPTYVHPTTISSTSVLTARLTGGRISLHPEWIVAHTSLDARLTGGRGPMLSATVVGSGSQLLGYLSVAHPIKVVIPTGSFVSVALSVPRPGTPDQVTSRSAVTASLAVAHPRTALLLDPTSVVSKTLIHTTLRMAGDVLIAVTITGRTEVTIDLAIPVPRSMQVEFSSVASAARKPPPVQIETPTGAASTPGAKVSKLTTNYT